jgi:hypothetical protein
MSEFKIKYHRITTKTEFNDHKLERREIKINSVFKTRINFVKLLYYHRLLVKSLVKLI